MVVFLGKGSLCGGGYWVLAQAALKGGNGGGGYWHPASVTCPGGGGQVIGYSHGLTP